VIVNYVKGRINGPSFEVANHGWNHEDFTTFGMEEQSALIERTNSKISYLRGIDLSYSSLLTTS
jgi:peptidoglycan/xylan/chitin deacetylase (PgdA/CDA1 family)